MYSIALNPSQYHFCYGPDLPFVKENIPLMLLTVSVNHWNDWGWEKCEIHARVYDVGGIGNLWVYHDNFGDFHSFTASNNGWYNVTLEIGWGAGLGEYTIHLETWDIAENHLMYNYTVKGLFAGVLAFLKDIWNTIAGALSKAWKAVKSAVDQLWNWFAETITRGFEAGAITMANGLSATQTGLLEGLILTLISSTLIYIDASRASAISEYMSLISAGVPGVVAGLAAVFGFSSNMVTKAAGPNTYKIVSLGLSLLSFSFALWNFSIYAALLKNNSEGGTS